MVSDSALSPRYPTQNIKIYNTASLGRCHRLRWCASRVLLFPHAPTYRKMSTISYAPLSKAFSLLMFYPGEDLTRTSRIQKTAHSARATGAATVRTKPGLPFAVDVLKSPVPQCKKGRG